jgi:hypothetical protein
VPGWVGQVAVSPAIALHAECEKLHHRVQPLPLPLEREERSRAIPRRDSAACTQTAPRGSLPKACTLDPLHWRERSEREDGGQGLSKVVYTSQDRVGVRDHHRSSICPPSSLNGLVQALTAHGPLSWVSGGAHAPPASLWPMVPPSPLRGSAAVGPQHPRLRAGQHPA